jgi:lipopolysaccharide export system protein LptA
VQGSGDSITARGNVRTVLYNTQGFQRKTPMTSRSDQLLARKNDRRLDLTGSVKIEDEGRTVTAEKSSLFFDANKKIEHIEAEKNVVVIEQAIGRKGTGDKMLYHVDKKTAEVFGNPATVTAPNGNFAGQQINVDMLHNKVDVISPTAKTKGTYTPQP